MQANPEARVFWLKDGQEVRERTGQCRLGWLNGLATLTIEEVLAEDEGEYVLRAENQLGQAEQRIRVTVKRG